MGRTATTGWSAALSVVVGATALVTLLVQAACSTDDVSEAPARLSSAAKTEGGGDAGACSPNCKALDPVTSLNELPGCARASTTANVVECAGNLACYLGRNPTKMEFLLAMGLGNVDVLRERICLPRSDSTQPIPEPRTDQGNGKVVPRAYRCIAGEFTPGTVWCSYTTLSDDTTIECTDISGPFGKNGISEACGQNQVGFDLSSICQTLAGDTTNEKPPVKPGDLFQQLNNQALTDCSGCHTKMPAKADGGDAGAPCYKFPFVGVFPVCPLNPLVPFCDGEGGAAVCKDGSKITCTDAADPARCADGSQALCSDGQPAICITRMRPSPGPTSGPDCDEARAMLAYALQLQTELPADELPDWANVQFLEAWLAVICPKKEADGGDAGDPVEERDGGTTDDAALAVETNRVERIP
jgi:hypothetical protein